MAIGAVTLMVSGADVATTTNNIVTASFTCTAGRLYLLMLSESTTCSGVTAGQNASTNWAYQKTQTNGTGIIVEVFGGICTTTTTATMTISWAGATTASYAVIEVQQPKAANTIVQKLSAAAATVTMGARSPTGDDPAIFVCARNTNAMSPKTLYVATANIGVTHRLLCSYNSIFDTAPSFSGTLAASAIIGLEVGSIALPGTATPGGLKMTGYGAP